MPICHSPLPWKELAARRKLLYKFRTRAAEEAMGCARVLGAAGAVTYWSDGRQPHRPGHRPEGPRGPKSTPPPARRTEPLPAFGCVPLRACPAHHPSPRRARRRLLLLIPFPREACSAPIRSIPSPLLGHMRLWMYLDLVHPPSLSLQHPESRHRQPVHESLIELVSQSRSSRSLRI